MTRVLGGPIGQVGDDGAAADVASDADFARVVGSARLFAGEGGMRAGLVDHAEQVQRFVPQGDSLLAQGETLSKASK